MFVLPAALLHHISAAKSLYRTCLGQCFLVSSFQKVTVNKEIRKLTLKVNRSTVLTHYIALEESPRIATDVTQIITERHDRLMT